MKRYLLFYGEFYYPEGGMLDFKSDHDTLEEAISEFELKKGSITDAWAHIYDTVERKIVFEHLYH